MPTDALLPAVDLIGATLRWHGALSFDVIDAPDAPDAPVVIDVNPRLVEPRQRRGGRPRPGVRPARRRHRPLPAGTADVAPRRPNPPVPARPPRRGADARTLRSRSRDARCPDPPRRLRGRQRGADPLAGDPIAAAALAPTVTALLAAPGLHSRLVGGSVAGYALTPAGWRRLLAEADAEIQGPFAPQV